MIEKEKELFKNLCSFRSESFDEKLLEAATPAVLGHLFFNRMAAIAYGTLEKCKLLSKVNREFRNSLKGAYEQNLEKNTNFFQCVQEVENIISQCNCNYALLKGAYLCKAYPEGYRTSNDIDILVHPNDVTEVGNALLKAGFMQGNVRGGKFETATRKEIIESKMMRGETVPYIKEVNFPHMKFLEVDINFSLDYKPGDINLIEEMMNNSTSVYLGDFSVRTLNSDDFFIHLCSHLYKEATTLPWIEMMRDMTLYKYCDIYMILNDVNKEQINCLFKRAEKLGMEKVCAFAVLHMSQLFNFNNLYAVDVAHKILSDDCDFVHMVVSPSEKKKYIFIEKNIFERFFADDRKILLEEVENNESTKYEG